eukprot:superscaffoldBa00000603_g5994
MDVALLIMSSLVSVIRWDTLSQLHLLCSLWFSLVFSFLPLSLFCFLCLSLRHHFLLPPFDDGCRFIIFCNLRGSRACDARGPRGQRPSQTFPT